MKILFVTINTNPCSTTRTLQRWLLLGRRSGIEPIVCVREEGRLARWLRDHEIPCIVDPMPIPSKWQPVTTVARVLRLANRCSEHGKIDIVFCNEHNAYLQCFALSRFLNCPILCQVHFSVKRGFCRWAFGGNRKPDALLWTSHQQRADCAEAIEGIVGEDQQHVVPLGIDVESFGGWAAESRDEVRRSWGFERDAIVLGTASAMRPMKRVEDFLELVRSKAEEFPNVRGVLAGDARAEHEPYRDRILQQIRRMGLGDRFSWLGRIADIQKFYSGIDIYISTCEYETFGMSVCEAMACRRPVAAYRGGSVHEVVGDAGRVVGVGDLGALSEAVSELIQDPGLRAELGERGRDRVARYYDPARSIAQLMGIYDSILSRRNHGSREPVS